MNQLFPAYKVRLLTAATTWTTSVPTCLALTSLLSQTDIDAGTYGFVSDLPDVVLPIRSAALGGLAVSSVGKAESSNAVFTSLNSGTSNIRSIVLFEDTGTDATSHLIAYMDAGDGLPFVAAGGVTEVEPVDSEGFFSV